MGYNLSGMSFSAIPCGRNHLVAFRPFLVAGGFCLFLMLCACRLDGTAEGPIQVSCASSLRYVMPQIVTEYEKATGKRIALSFASSGSIYQQIRSGAPVDLFCSADKKRIEMLLVEGLLDPSSVATYALGKLVVCCSSEVKEMPTSVESLAGASYGRIAWANPALAPYGLAAQQVLRASQVEREIEKKAVYGDNVGQILTYLMRGDVDCAFLPLSFVIWSGDRYLEVPSQMYSPIEQVMGVTNTGHHFEGGKDFGRFILGPRGREILARNGFSLPAPGDRG